MRTELPNAYGPMEHEGVEYERTPGWFNIWTDKACADVHMFEFSDGCYRADAPVTLETLKVMRDKLDAYIKGVETPTEQKG